MKLAAERINGFTAVGSCALVQPVVLPVLFFFFLDLQCCSTLGGRSATQFLREFQRVAGTVGEADPEDSCRGKFSW